MTYFNLKKTITTTFICLFVSACASNKPISNASRCDAHEELAPVYSDNMSNPSIATMMQRANEIRLPSSISTRSGKTDRFKVVNGQLVNAGKKRFDIEIDNCTQALASSALHYNWLRKSSLLRARAAYHLLNDKPTDALQDIKQARALFDDRQIDKGLQNGFLVGLDMIEGLILMRTGDKDRADQLIRRAADKYPYSSTLQLITVAHLSAKYVLSDEGRTYLQRVGSLSPRLLEKNAELLQWQGSDPQMVFDYRKQLISLGVTNYTFVKDMLRNLDKQRESQANDSADDKNESFPNIDSASAGPIVYVKAAVAAARLNKFDEAKQWLEQSKALNQFIKKGSKMKPYWSYLMTDPNKYLTIDLYIEHSEKLIQAFNHYYNSDTEAFREFLGDNKSLPNNGATMDLVRMSAKKLGQSQSTAGNIYHRTNTLNKQRTPVATETVIAGLYNITPVYVDSGSNNRFAKSIYLLNSNGFKEKRLGDNRMKVEYLGGQSSKAAVEEMSMLRAAIVAQKTGRKYLTVEKRNDYDRYLTSSGASYKSSNAGFKSEMTVRLLTSNQLNDASVTIDVDGVIAELSTKYQ